MFITLVVVVDAIVQHPAEFLAVTVVVALVVIKLQRTLVAQVLQTLVVAVVAVLARVVTMNVEVIQAAVVLLLSDTQFKF
jgi:hypothetical protein